MSSSFLVLGAGIGGLVAAVALARRGHRVDVVERAPALAPLGAGIILGANATSILAALGIDVTGAGHPLSSLDVLAANGRLLQGMPLADMDAVRGRMLSFHRGELHAALRAALPDGVTLRLGTTVTALEDLGERVRVRTSDGAESEHALVVGADGLRSETRRRVHGDLPLRYAGETCWRAVVPGVSEAGTAGAEVWGVGVRMGVIPLTGGRVYVFLVQVAAPGSDAQPAADATEAVLARFAGLGGPCPSALARMPGVPLLHHDLYELDAPVWGAGRVWLLGDAAHGMTPNQGQGAGMAIEDAAVLAECVGSGALDAVAAHARYVEARHARVRRVQLDSRRLGQVATVQNGLGRALRDLVLPVMPASLAKAQITALVAPGLAIAARIGSPQAAG